MYVCIDKLDIYIYIGMYDPYNPICGCVWTWGIYLHFSALLCWENQVSSQCLQWGTISAVDKTKYWL